MAAFDSCPGRASWKRRWTDAEPNSISIEKIRAAIYKHLVLEWEMGPNIEGHLAMLRLSLEMTDQVIASLPVTKGNQKRIIIYINRYSRYIGYKRLIEEYGLDADARRHFSERGARLFPGQLAGKWRRV